MTLTWIECHVQVAGDTPLHTACRAGNLHQVLQLISAGADVEAVNFVSVCLKCVLTMRIKYSSWRNHAGTSMHTLFCNHQKCIESCEALDACAMVQEDHTSLHAACKAGHVEMVKHLCGQYGTLLKKKTVVCICMVHLS